MRICLIIRALSAHFHPSFLTHVSRSWLAIEAIDVSLQAEEGEPVRNETSALNNLLFFCVCSLVA
jgi:hypothetical protein